MGEMAQQQNGHKERVTEDMELHKAIKIGNNYQCPKCGRISKRRFNINRHYARMHTHIHPEKRCCEITFFTKEDFYIHREKVHKEEKKYTKGQNQNICDVSEIEQTSCFPKQQDTETSSRLRFSETQNNNETRLCESVPKKFFLQKWQNNSSQVEESRAVLKNIQNVSRRTAKKRASQKIKLSNSLSSKKENVKLYTFKCQSKEDVEKALYSIKF